MCLCTGSTCVPEPCLPTAQTPVSQLAVMTRTIHRLFPACLSELLRCPCRRKHPESTSSLLRCIALAGQPVTYACNCWLALMRLSRLRLELCSLSNQMWHSLPAAHKAKTSSVQSNRVVHEVVHFTHTGHVMTRIKHIHNVSVLQKKASNWGAPLWIQPLYTSLTLTPHS